MGIESTTKVVTLVSGITAVMISVIGFFIDQRIKAADERLKEVKQSVELSDAQSKTAISLIKANAKAKIDEANTKAVNAETELTRIKVAQAQFDLSAKLQVSFRLPMARAFADSFDPSKQDFAMPTTALGSELRRVLPDWKARKDLMAGNACSNAGLLARQVIMLEVRNVGAADAEQIKLRFLVKSSAQSESTAAWHKTSQGQQVQYYDIPAAGSDWPSVEIQLRTLPSSRIANRGSNSTTVILASVSGSSTFYGTVAVPVELSWTDAITNKPQTMRIMDTEKASLRSSLIGAEIGNIGSACPH